nr:hypothetical protein [Tanacetum cinerariifolium]
MEPARIFVLAVAEVWCLFYICRPEKSTCLLPRVLLITIGRIEEENYMVLIVDIFEPDETVVLDKPKL